MLNFTRGDIAVELRFDRGDVSACMKLMDVEKPAFQRLASFYTNTLGRRETRE